MKGWLLAPLLVASGCLYLDGVNKPPAVSFSDAQQLSTNIGAHLTLMASAQDPEDGTLPADHVTYNVFSADGQPLDPACDYRLGDIYQGKDIQFFRKGIFRVEATAQDSHGAPPVASASIMVAIDDAPPVFDTSAVPKPSVAVSTCGYFAPGERVPIGLMGGTVKDPDMFGPCQSPTSTLSYTWRVVPPPGAKPVMTAFSGGCADPTASSGLSQEVTGPSDQACLVTDPNVATPNTVYMVLLEVSDGDTVVQSKSASIAVGPNALPCITANTPSIGRYVIDRTQPFWLSVAGAIDDRQTFYGNDPIRFAWSLSTDSDPTWHDVPDYSASSYQLDPSSFAVGEVVHVRAEAVDDSGVRTMASSCAPSRPAGDCDLLDTCIAPVCHRWRTWDLELR